MSGSCGWMPMGKRAWRTGWPARRSRSVSSWGGRSFGGVTSTGAAAWGCRVLIGTLRASAKACSTAKRSTGWTPRSTWETQLSERRMAPLARAGRGPADGAAWLYGPGRGGPQPEESSTGFMAGSLRSHEGQEDHFEALQMLLPLLEKSAGMGLGLVVGESAPVPVQLIEKSDLRLLVDLVDGVEDGPGLMGFDELECLGDQLVEGRAIGRAYDRYSYGVCSPVVARRAEGRPAPSRFLSSPPSGPVPGGGCTWQWMPWRPSPTRTTRHARPGRRARRRRSRIRSSSSVPPSAAATFGWSHGSGAVPAHSARATVEGTSSAGNERRG
jgi:hypothetical protein